jgi:hypothetical protein
MLVLKTGQGFEPLRLHTKKRLIMIYDTASFFYHISSFGGSPVMQFYLTEIKRI